MRNSIIKRRIELGLTQAKVAEKLGLQVPNYCNFEKGLRNFSLQKWRELQIALNIPDSDMWGIVNE